MLRTAHRGCVVPLTGGSGSVCVVMVSMLAACVPAERPEMRARTAEEPRGSLRLALERLADYRLLLRATNLGTEAIVLDGDLVIGFDVDLYRAGGARVLLNACGDEDVAATHEVTCRRRAAADRFVVLAPGESLARVVPLREIRVFMTYHSSSLTSDGIMIHGKEMGAEVLFRLPTSVSLDDIAAVAVRYVGGQEMCREAIETYIGVDPAGLRLFDGVAMAILAFGRAPT